MESTGAARARGGRPRSFDRDAALEAAMAAFWTHGYRDASIGLLTRAMGITPPSLYAAFGSKAQLFVEAADLYQRHEGAPAAAALQADGPARQAVEGMLLANADLFTRPDRPPGCLLTRAALTCPHDEPEVGAYLREVHCARLADLEVVLRRAQRRGERLPLGGPVELAAYVDTVVQGMAVRAAEGVDRRSLRRTVRTALAVWEGEAPA